jgi:hypothetical protein
MTVQWLNDQIDFVSSWSNQTGSLASFVKEKDRKGKPCLHHPTS